MLLLIMLLLGIGLGYSILMLKVKKQSAGTLRIDHSDPDEAPYLFLESTKEVNWLYKQKYVVFKVNVKDYVTQK